MTKKKKNVGNVGFNPIGTHDPNKEYQKLELVSDSSGSYIARKHVPFNSNIPTTDTEYWQISALSGEKGEPGTVNPLLATLIEGSTDGVQNGVVYSGLQEKLEILDAAVDKIINGRDNVYCDVANILSNSPSLAVVRYIEDNYLIATKSTTGNSWLYAPFFTVTGNSNIIIEFDIEYTNIGVIEALNVYVADSDGVAGNYTKIASDFAGASFKMEVDPTYYTIYEGWTPTTVWLATPTIGTGETWEAKISNLKIYEVVEAVDAANISGANSKELFESIDSQISELKSASAAQVLISPSGFKYLLAVDDLGAPKAIPVIPETAAYFGNSLLTSFGYGMAASAIDKDYYYLINQAILAQNAGYSSTRNRGTDFEIIEDAGNVASVIQTEFLDVVTGNEELLIIQLGDNVNNAARLAVFETSCQQLLSSLRAACPNARIIWAGMWYSSTERYDIIKEACKNTGCELVSFVGLLTTENQSEIGNTSEVGNDTRVLENVTGVVENNPTNITVTFEVSSVSYESTLEVDSYSLVSTTLTYISDFLIIDSAGVASHPGDNGMKTIANKILYMTGISDIENYY